MRGQSTDDQDMISGLETDRSADHPGAKYQQIEDSEDDLIAGAMEGVQQHQVGVARESAVQSNG